MNDCLTGLSTSCIMESPIGSLRLAVEDDCVTCCEMLDDIDCDVTPCNTAVSDATPLLVDVMQQLNAYFSGKLGQFDLPLAPAGTDFQCSVWRALQTIPYGETWSYQQLAEKVGNPRAMRAVGSANGKNPICIIIPCHRVIRANGDLGGFGGGLHRKRWLLSHEGSW